MLENFARIDSEFGFDSFEREAFYAEAEADGFFENRWIDSDGHGYSDDLWDV